MCSSVVIVVVSRVTAVLCVMMPAASAPTVLHISAPTFVTDVCTDRRPLVNSWSDGRPDCGSVMSDIDCQVAAAYSRSVSLLVAAGALAGINASASAAAMIAALPLPIEVPYPREDALYRGRMRAAQYPAATGEIEIVELPDPEPGPGEVLVEVHVSGVNPTDWKGRLRKSAGSGHVIPNQDGAGVVVGVGDGVDEARVGERVWLWFAQWERAHGTAAELIALPQELAVPLPEGISLDVGAGLGIPAMTAHRCVFLGGPVQDAAVLVHGGAGAVGHAAIQLAVWGGARVAATVSSEEKAALARAAGAELVVDYRAQDVAAAVRGWAADGVGQIVEVDLGNVAVDAAVIADGGGIAAYARADAQELPWDLFARNARIDLVLVYTMPAAAKEAAVAAIGEALRAGSLQPLPFTRFPLEQTQAAHEAVEAGAVGKVLIDVRA